MKKIDIQLFSIFDEIYKTRNVSKAALNCELSQPSISLGLSRLRKHYSDPLFVRTSVGMEPTPLANVLAVSIREILERIEFTLGYQATFDPQKSDRLFRICVTDVSQNVVMPELMNMLKSDAPNLRLSLINASDKAPDLMKTGEIDLAIGFMPMLDADFHQQRLFDEDFICIASAEHSRIGKALTLTHFTNENHLVVITSGTGHWIISKTLDAQRISRKIALDVENFLGIGPIIASTDLIATVPRRFGQIIALNHKLKTYPSPIALPPYSVKQYWHERFDNDLGNKWLREAIARLFAES